MGSTRTLTVEALAESKERRADLQMDGARVVDAQLRLFEPPGSSRRCSAAGCAPRRPT
jgi:hypothetical protein